jgi:hypothetical protein
MNLSKRIPTLIVTFLLFVSTTNAQTTWNLTGNTGTTAGTHFLGTTDAKDLVFKTGAVEYLRLKTGTGNLGIGTANPATKLDIANGTSFLRIYGNAFGDIQSSASFSPHFASGSFNVFQGNVGTGTLRFQIAAGGNTYLTPVAGNVGIGTTSPIARVDIKGTGTTDNVIRVANSSNVENFIVKSNGFVYAREVQVLPSGTVFPDYVFEKDYSLMSLSELEDYINNNKHLPGVPSAKEVDNNGFGLSQMQTLQMKKIEELTLYIIELQKQINELKAKQ